MAKRKIRTGKKYEVLNKGETYLKSKDTYRYTYTDSYGERRSIYSKDLKKLREKEKELVIDQLDGLDIYLMGKADVNFLFDRYIGTKSNLRNTTRSNYLYMYDRYVRSGFGKRKVASIKYSDVVLFYKHLMNEKGLKVNTVDSVHTLLHPAFQLGVRDDVIRKNPSDGAMAELKRSLPKTAQKEALTLDEERAFLGYLEDPKLIRWKPFFTIMFGTGCRVGELTGLRWEDVDLDKGYISINHTLTYYPVYEKSSKCEFHISRPKTEAGVRMIPMLVQVKEAFLEERKRQEDTGEHCKSVVDGMSGFIFYNRFQEVHSPSTLNRAIERIRTNYNSEEVIKAKRERREPVIIPHFSNHIARHTFCTRLCENETNIKVIQDVMGHSEIETTMNIYASVTERKKQLAINDLNDKDIM